MSSRFRTSCPDQSRVASRSQGSGTAGLRPGAETAPVLAYLLFTALLIFTGITVPTPARAATPVGTVISNTAAAAYSDGPSSGGITTNSNTVTVTTVAFRTPSTVEFLSYAPQLAGATPVNVAPGAYRPDSDPSVPLIALPLPVPAGSTTPIDLTNPVPLAPATIYHVGEPIFVRVTDLDQNLDSGNAETIITTITDSLTGDIEIIRLTETGADTGVFVGYIQSTSKISQNPYNGTLPVAVDSSIKAKYTDIHDNSDSSNDAALVDPYGIVFDSATGKPVDGVTVTLINTVSGDPATVFGDDGVSAFPATVITGSAFVVNGRNYSFPPGGFRYPFVNPGNYRFQITPPADYVAPSTVSDARLQSLPGGPFSLVTPGSRLEQFTINPGPAIHIDIPVDPLSSALWLQKSAGKEIVAAGDFIPYQLDLQNTLAVVTAPGITIADTLPLGFRYQQGSTRLNGAAAPDPVISADGRTLTFAVGDLAARAVASIRFVAEVAAGARLGTATNMAIARSTSGVTSNLATASVMVRSDFMNSQSIIMGEMIVGPCEAPLDKSPMDLSGIRIFLEDGTYVVTDKNGMYHFDGVKPGTRVVQLDLDSVPQKYEILSCEENSRFAGKNHSQFVDLQGGVLWRADFYLGLRAKLTGEVGLELLSSLQKEESANDNGDTVEYSVPIRIGPVPVRNLRLTVMLADGLLYRTGTSSLDRRPLPDPSGMESVVTFGLGDFPENWAGTVRFKAAVPLAGKSGKLTTRALLTFHTPEKENVRTPVADNILARNTAHDLQPAVAGTVSAPQIEGKGSAGQPARLDEKQLQQVRTTKRIAMPEIVLHPHFPTFGAELSEVDRRMIDNLSNQLTGLNIEEVTVTGHTDHIRIAPRSRHVYPDNEALSKARAESVGRYLAAKLHVPTTKLTLIGKGATEPVADNRTDEGRAINRRVEVKITTLKLEATPRDEAVKNTDASPKRAVLDTQQPVPISAAHKASVREPGSLNALVNEKDRSGVKTVATVGLRPGEKWLATTDREAAAKDMPEYNVAWLGKAEPGPAWLWPASGYHPPIPSVKIAVKHDPRNTLKLFLNGAEVDSLSFDGVVKREDNTIAVSTWRGIHITDGDNFFEAAQFDEHGTETWRLKQTIHYSTPPVKAEFVPVKSRLIADGKNPSVIAVRLTDKDGHPAREGIIGEYALDPPYISQRADELRNAPLASPSGDKLKYKVGDDGVALIELQPTTKADEAVLRFNLMSGSQEIRARLMPDYREWILVGIAEGTAGYNTLSGNMENLQASGTEENFYDRERLAFYAKGTIKGDWLLTMAYDSAKERTGVTGNALFQTIDPNSYYTLYGDATAQGYEAASQRKLYLKIERDQFQALFGDYDTGLAVTELSRYSRRMNGIKSEYRSKDFEVTAFGAETAQAFVKDELRGDGTSGLYRLTRQGIVINSEKIALETRDRFHSEVVTNSQQLNRFIDYSIDYDTGAIFFKSPVPSKDELLNPVYIVVDYETATAGKDALTFGGRAGTTLLGGQLKAGATYVHEGHVNGESNLYGVDTTVKLGPDTKARAEFATTTTDIGTTKTDGSAWLAEISHTDKNLSGKVYYREQDDGFGLGQQKGSETATRKFGADGAYKLNQQVGIGGQGYRQYNLATGAVRDLIESSATYTVEQYSGRAGLRYANDSLADGSNATSIQGTVGGSWLTMNKRLTLRADHEQSLFDNNNNSDFPTRTTLGADYQLTRDTLLFAQEELTYGATANTNTTRVGVKAAPWSGGTVATSVVNDINENSARTFATVGLAQKLQLNPFWTVDGGLDHSETIKKKTGYQFNTNVPPASGGDDFTAVSLGANYTERKLSWSNRVEFRDSDTVDKWGVISGLVNEPGLNWGWTGRLQIMHSQATGGTRKDSADLRLGLAYRPPLARWVVLDRLDLIISDDESASASTTSRRLVNNLNANYKPDRQTQVSLQYGAKYVLDTIDASDYSGYTDLIGIEGRYDITSKCDVGLRGAVIHSWGPSQFSYSLAPSIGFNMMENAWLNLGYNVIGFEDRDFSNGSFTAQGPFVQFRFKFDQNSVKDGLKALNQ